MNKYIIVILLAFGLAACTVKDKHYYQWNHKELQKALKACPNQQPQGISCDELKELANKMNQLAYQLQNSPQGFGSKIILLQEKISNPEFKADIEKNKVELADLMSVAKWLESPEG